MNDYCRGGNSGDGVDHHPNFLLGNNRLDKQLARIRMNNASNALPLRGLV
jgi:hypothetical protein